MSFAFPFDCKKNTLDRALNSEELRAVISSIMSNGIIGNGLKVVPSDGIGVSVSTGKCVIKGAIKNFRTKSLISLDDSIGKYVTVVLRFDKTDNVRDIVIDKVDSYTEFPDLIRTSEIYELGLANIKIKQGATEINSSAIIDTRFDSDVCGICKFLGFYHVGEIPIGHLGTASSMNATSELNDDSEDKVLTAKGGKTLNDKISTINGTLSGLGTSSTMDATDSLIEENSNKVLSAKGGKTLNDKIISLQEELITSESERAITNGKVAQGHINVYRIGRLVYIEGIFMANATEGTAFDIRGYHQLVTSDYGDANKHLCINNDESGSDCYLTIENNNNPSDFSKEVKLNLSGATVGNYYNISFLFLSDEF